MIDKIMNGGEDNPNAKLLYEDHIQTFSQEMKLECTEEVAAEESEELQMDTLM